SSRASSTARVRAQRGSSSPPLRSDAQESATSPYAPCDPRWPLRPAQRLDCERLRDCDQPQRDDVSAAQSLLGADENKSQVGPPLPSETVCTGFHYPLASLPDWPTALLACRLTGRPSQGPAGAPRTRPVRWAVRSVIRLQARR